MKKKRVIASLLSLATLAVFGLCGVAHAQWNTCGAALCTNPRDQYLPVAASDGAGGTIIAWADHRSSTATGTSRWLIYSQRLDNLGMPKWAIDGVKVAPDSAVADTLFDQENPAIVADGSGGAYIAWVDKHRYPSTDIYLQHIDSNGAPAWATLDGGLAVTRAAHVQQNPTLVTDGAGGVIVVWQGSTGSSFDIYAQRVNPAGVLQWAGGLPTASVAVCAARNSQFRPRAIPDGASGAIIVWYDERLVVGISGGQDLFAQRLDGTGAPLWTLNGVPVFGTATSSFAGDQRFPELISDGAGGAIITCESGSFTTDHGYEIAAQRLNTLGAQQWTASGAIVCSASFDQRYPNLTTDGSGGAIIAWHDYRKGANLDSDIYAQRVNASGVLQWAGGLPTGGVAVCTSIYNQSFPNVVTDGLGGAIIVWYDERGATPNLFAQRLDPLGAAQWTAGGVGICGTPYGTYAHSTFADGVGGAIVAWQDGRSTNTDVYAARVTFGGGLGAPAFALGVGDRRAGGLVLGAPSPNPTSRELSVQFVLPSAAPAVLELLDVTGRMVEHHEVGSLGPGVHVIRLGRAAALRAGLYFVRLRQNGASLFAKASVIP